MRDEEIKSILKHEFGFEGQLLNHLIMESLDAAGFKEGVPRNRNGEFEASFLGKKGVGNYPLAAMKNLWVEIYNDPKFRNRLEKKMES
jgi:hypothetical protein